MQGQHYLHEQLNSIIYQTHKDWIIWVSDDGSSDDTHAILNEYRSKLGESRFFVHNGPSDGFAANFLSLTCKASISADYYAYADQDDIWEKDKLACALEYLKTVPSHLPALYCGRTRIVDINNCDIGLSPLYIKPPKFTNALVQSIAGGNTMVFNNAARNFLRIAGPTVKVVAHDWWAYIVISGCGGQVFYDKNPKVRYRQHGNNLIGRQKGLSAGLIRFRMLFQLRFQNWIDVNLLALKSIYEHLTPENKLLMNEFSKARKSCFINRLIGLKRSGIYRQTILGNIGLIAAGIFRKI